MDPQIVFLGTGGGRYVMAEQSRATGGIIIQDDSRQIHLDPGPGALLRALQYKIDPEKTNMILVSHDHVDHSNDANVLIDIMTHGGLAKKGHLITNKHTNEEVITPYHRSCLKENTIMEHGKKLRLGDLIIEAVKTKHHKNSLGFKIVTNEYCVGYTSDTLYFADLARFYENCEVLIINNALPFGVKGKIHLSSDDTVKILNKIKPKLAILTHFGPGMIKISPIQEARRITKLTGVQTIAATDGLVVDLKSYSAELEQKRIDLY